MKRHGAIVEFVGPPGAGKSLLAEHLREAWLEEGFRAPERKKLRRRYLETGPIARWTKRRFDKGKAPPGTLYEWRTRIWEERQAPWLRGLFTLRHPSAMWAV
ncbi:MAG: hypothetical protein CL910_01895, partial [Deltaproteobacteria bacterium]|nr:hypothetical protein [Deltaproteobacteria bacterium]